MITCFNRFFYFAYLCYFGDVTLLSHICHTQFFGENDKIANFAAILLHKTMKTVQSLLLTSCICFLVACSSSGNKPQYSPVEEQRVAHGHFVQACRTDTDDGKDRTAMFDRAIYHFANIVVRPDADDTLRADALYTLRWIEAYEKHNYELALQYLNQYMALVGSEHSSYPMCLAYKADDLWHFGAQDSAMHYAYKALAAPHERYDGVEYVCHYVLWQIYEVREMSDSAERHKSQHIAIRDSRVFEPMTMDELKSKLETNVITPDIQAGAEAFGAFAEIRANRIREEAEHKNRMLDRHLYATVTILLLLVASIFIYSLMKRRLQRIKEPNAALAAMGPTDNKSAPEAKAPMLCRMLVEGRQVFEHTTVYADILTMQVNERVLPDITYEVVQEMEHALLESFNSACCLLIEQCEFNDQELICALGVYLGYSNVIIAHLGNTTTATIRKRKERIRKKLPADLYEVIFGRQK